MKFFKRMINNMKLRSKLVISYLMLVLIPMITIFVYFQYRLVYQLEENTLQMEKIIMDQAAESIENYISQLENTANVVAQSENIQQILTCNEEQLEELMSNQRKRDSVVTYMKNIHSRMDGVVVQDIKIYCDPGRALFQERRLNDYGIFESVEKIDASLWYGNLMSKGQNSIVASAFYMVSSEGEDFGFTAYIKKIPYYVEGEKNIAFAAVYFNCDYLLDVLEGYGDLPGSCIYIMDEKDNVVAAQGEEVNLTLMLPYQSIENIIGKEKIFSKINYGSHESWSIYYNIEQADWKLVFTVLAEAIVQSTQEDGALLMMCYLVIAVLLCFLMLALAHSITGRVTMLRNRMVQVKEALPERLEIPHYEDEIGQLTESYNDMVEKIHELMNEKNRIMKENNRMEMNLLRSQLNPHFLYNTLDMISWYAIKGNTKDVTDSVQALARFYRLSLNNGELRTSLEKEILLIEKYVELQKRRTFSDIELVVDIPDEMLEQKIPQFLLQPLVENSLKHGILEKEEPKGFITITGWMEEQEIVLILADDGIGMAEEILEDINQKDRPDMWEEQRENHIGIRNIYRRLMLFYGERGFSMEYSSVLGEGTSVEIHLSYEVKTEEELENV